METNLNEIITDVEQINTEPVKKSRKETNKKYYDKHRENILLHQKRLREEIMPVVTCECGRYQSRVSSNIHRHLRSSKHLKYMNLNAPKQILSN